MFPKLQSFSEMNLPCLTLKAVADCLFMFLKTSGHLVSTLNDVSATSPVFVYLDTFRARVIFNAHGNLKIRELRNPEEGTKTLNQEEVALLL